jgi:hypothetical protein
MLGGASSMRALLALAWALMDDDEVVLGDEDENDTVAGDDGSAQEDGTVPLNPGCLIA